MRFLILILAAVLPVYPANRIDTFAGGVIRSGVPAQDVLLGTVNGTTWDSAGNLVFGDTTNNVLRRVRTDGVIETIAGTGVFGFGGDGGPASRALMNGPASPCYDSAGNLYFADLHNYRIRRIDPRGIITTIAGNGFPSGNGGDGPAVTPSPVFVGALAVDRSGNVYFSEPSLNRIRLVTARGDIVPFASLGVNAELYAGITVDAAGNLYAVLGPGFAESRNAAIVRISPDGTIAPFVQFHSENSFPPLRPSAIAADAAGNVYAVMGRSIVRYDANGTSTLVAGGQGPSADGPAIPSSIYPQYLTVDAHGSVGFVDTFYLIYTSLVEIREITGNSMLKTLAGGNPQPAPDGTPLRGAWFLSPSSLTFSRAGDLYIAEFAACLIRRIGADGVLTTFAGTGKCGYPAPSGNAKTADLVYPVSIAVDSQDRVWVADYYLNLYSISQDGTLSPMMPTPATGGKGQLAFDARDRLYVLSFYSLVRSSAGGGWQPIGSFPRPSFGGLGTDRSGNVYFSGGDNIGAIYRINMDGTFALACANPYSFSPSLAVDDGGNIWMSAGSELDVCDASGLERFGWRKSGYSGDRGPLDSAGFSGTSSLAFAPDGELYLIDGTRIRVVSPIRRPSRAR